MTPLELEFLNVLKSLNAYLVPGRIYRRDYSAMMDELRLAIKKGDAVLAGCPMGIHFSPCECKEGMPGLSLNWLHHLENSNTPRKGNP